MMPPLETLIYAPDMFTLEIPEPCAIKTSLILLPIGNYLHSLEAGGRGGVLKQTEGNWAGRVTSFVFK